MSQSVIVSTYNKPQHLELVLEGLRHQDVNDYEVIVADDGSTDDTAHTIEGFARSVDFRVEHVWQPDEGFRAARIRNLGVRAARGQSIVFLDGDCVPFPDFLRAHAEAAEPGVGLAGDRLFLDREPSAALTADDVASGRFRTILPRDQYRALANRERKDRFYRWTRLKERPKVVTANFSLERETLDRVNGLDERFVGWGHEDEDLRRRLVRVGVRIESVLRSARVCHLWHRHVESFRGKVKLGDNVDYYHRGFFLGRCRAGLESRALRDCRLLWNGQPPTEGNVEVAIGWGRDPRLPGAEIRVAVVDHVPKRAIADLYLVQPGSAPTSKLGELIAGRVGAEYHLRDSLDPESATGREQLLAILDDLI